ncbi:hypothetical protein [Streptomyces gossypii]|uniref:hypothetical protein n=1 Tax=Streptomyces gossypii TaxID=2883101 RepID=UPI0021A2A027|nr:hypothetical protein [Streptomyces gossypii]
MPSRGPRERRNEGKHAFQAAVTTALLGLATDADGPVIVAGDLTSSWGRPPEPEQPQ